MRLRNSFLSFLWASVQATRQLVTAILNSAGWILSPECMCLPDGARIPPDGSGLAGVCWSGLCCVLAPSWEQVADNVGWRPEVGQQNLEQSFKIRFYNRIKSCKTKWEWPIVFLGVVGTILGAEEEDNISCSMISQDPRVLLLKELKLGSMSLRGDPKRRLFNPISSFPSGTLLLNP